MRAGKLTRPGSQKPLHHKSLRRIVALSFIALWAGGSIAWAYTEFAFPFTFASNNRLQAIRLESNGDIRYQSELPFAVYVRGGQGGENDEAYLRRLRVVEDVLAPNNIDLISSGWGSLPINEAQVNDIVRRCRDNDIRWYYDLFKGPTGDQQTADVAYGLPGFNDSVGLGGWIHADDADILYPNDGNALPNINTMFANDFEIKNVAAPEYEPGVPPIDVEVATIATLSGGAVNNRNVVRQYAEAADILVGQSYPINQTFVLPWQTYTGTQNIVRECERSARGAIPMIALQLEGPNTGLGRRRPVPAELDVMTYLALAAGAKGLFYYQFDSDDEGPVDLVVPELYQKLIELRREVEFFEDDFLNSDRFSRQPLASRKCFYGRWRRSNNDCVVIMINAELPESNYTWNAKVPVYWNGKDPQVFRQWAGHNRPSPPLSGVTEDRRGLVRCDLPPMSVVLAYAKRGQ